jgi:hypothetical protein
MKLYQKYFSLRYDKIKSGTIEPLCFPVALLCLFCCKLTIKEAKNTEAKLYFTLYYYVMSLLIQPHENFKS